MLQRVVVVGTSGSGKTTLARQIAQKLCYPHIELDALHWRPNWTEAPEDEFREAIAAAIATQQWVLDGNYSRARELIWSQADTLVWLDYPKHLVMRRIIWRTLRRSMTREELWSGNRERFRTSFMSRESVIWWAWTTYERRRRTYGEVFESNAYPHLHKIRLQTPRVANQWVAGIGK